MKTCENCEHWDRIGTTKMGRCEKAKASQYEDQKDVPGGMALRPKKGSSSFVLESFGEVTQGIELVTSEEFGCIHFNEIIY